MYGLLFDANQCIGCGACLDACKEENSLPASAQEVLSATDYSVLEEHSDVYLRRMCMHCIEPSCASACPVGALQKTPAGPVTYDFDRCIGCRYCMVACPFSVPRYEWSSMTPRVQKCQMCPHRVSKGEPTACAEACDEGATVFGERTELLAEAWKRIAASPGEYAPRVYGAEEAGGTSILIIGPPEIMAAFDQRIPNESLPQKTWAVLSQIPTAVGVAGVGLLGVNWIIHRRMSLAAAARNGEPKTAGTDPDTGGRSREKGDRS